MDRKTLIAAALFLPTGLLAQDFATATQTLILEVRSVASISVTGDPSPLRITTGEAGSATLSVSDASTSYNITSNRPNMKLSVSVDEPVPPGTRLFVEMEGATGVSAGRVEISDATAPVDAVTGIDKGTVTGQTISYVLEADAARGPLAAESRTIILTLTD